MRRPLSSLTMAESVVDCRLTPLDREVRSRRPGTHTVEEVILPTNEKGEGHGINFAGIVLKQNK